MDTSARTSSIARCSSARRCGRCRIDSMRGALVGLALTCAALLPLGAVADESASLSSSDVLAHRIKDYLADQMLADAFSGVVVLSRHDQIVFSGVYGWASKEYGVPNALDTRFNLGSINKLMTRIAIVQLVEQHKLSYGDTIDAVLPDYP